MKCGGFFCTHHEALLCETALCIHYSEAQALSVTHARISLPHASYRLLLVLSSMKVMHLSTYCDYDNSCDGIASRSLNILHFS